MIDLERSREFWNRQARDRRYETEFGPGMLLHDRRLALARKRTEEGNFVRLIDLLPEQTVVDVGCGTGRWALFFAERVRRVVGTDLSDAMIERARAVATSAAVANVTFEVREASRLDGLPTADLVHAGGVLQCLSDEDVARFGRAARELLAPGGRIVSRDSVGQRRVELSGAYPVVYRTDEEYARLFEGAGFELEKSARACYFPEILPRVIRFLPLRGRLLDAAIEADGRIVRTWPFPALLRLHHRRTGRGSGLVLDHRFAVWRPKR